MKNNAGLNYKDHLSVWLVVGQNFLSDTLCLHYEYILAHIIINIILKLSTTLSANMMPLSNEDYFNQFTFNQVTNIMMNNNNNNSQNNNMSNSNQFTYHTLQSPQIQNNQNYNNQPISSNNLNMNSYMSMTGSQSAGYSPKITTRTPSYNPSLCGSSPSSSSPSSLLSSSATSLNNLGQSSNAQNAVSSSTNESFDYDNASSSGTPSAPANDPAELARQKQLRGLTLTPEELQLLAKDRQRKDNHNMSKFFLSIIFSIIISF